MSDPDVLRLTPYFDWPGAGGGAAPSSYPAVGGIQRQALRQSQALDALGLRQTVMALPMEGGPSKMALGAHGTVHATGSAPRAGTGPIAAQLSWATGVWREVGGLGVQVIHAHSSCAPWTMLGALGARRRLGAALVVTVHCSILATYRPSSRRDAAFQHLARAVERAAVRRAAHTFVLSARLRDALLAARLAAPERISVLPDAVDGGRLRELADDHAAAGFAARHALPSTEPVAAYVGRISPEKGWPTLVVLAQMLEDHGRGHLLICGGGEAEADLRRAVAERGLGHRVTLAGELAADAVPAAMRCSRLLVLPSSFEEMGSVLVEGQALGLPAVAFDVGGVGEVVVPERTGLLVRPGDEAALGTAVLRLLDDPALAARMGAEGARRTGERHDLASAAREMLAVYREVR